MLIWQAKTGILFCIEWDRSRMLSREEALKVPSDDIQPPYNHTAFCKAYHILDNPYQFDDLLDT